MKIIAFVLLVLLIWLQYKIWLQDGGIPEVIQLQQEVEEVKTRISKFANNYKYGDTRDRVKIDEALAGEGSDYSKCCGWFDLENDFMFFTDEKMWREMCDGLSVKVPSKKQMSKV